MLTARKASCFFIVHVESNLTPITVTCYLVANRASFSLALFALSVFETIPNCAFGTSIFVGALITDDFFRQWIAVSNLTIKHKEAYLLLVTIIGSGYGAVFAVLVNAGTIDALVDLWIEPVVLDTLLANFRVSVTLFAQQHFAG